MWPSLDQLEGHSSIPGTTSLVPGQVCDKATPKEIDLRTFMGSLGKQEFCVSLEFYDLVESRPGVASGHPCYPWQDLS